MPSSLAPSFFHTFPHISFILCPSYCSHISFFHRIFSLISSHFFIFPFLHLYSSGAALKIFPSLRFPNNKDNQSERDGAIALKDAMHKLFENILKCFSRLVRLDVSHALSCWNKGQAGPLQFLICYKRWFSRMQIFGHKFALVLINVG